MSKMNTVLNAFENGEELTAKQLTARYGVTNPTALVHALRSEGYAIYLNKRTDSRGQTKMKYRLGTPTRRIIAAGIAALGAEGAGLV